MMRAARIALSALTVTAAAALANLILWNWFLGCGYPEGVCLLIGH